MGDKVYFLIVYDFIKWYLLLFPFSDNIIFTSIWQYYKQTIHANMINLKLIQKNALVCGSTKGIGKATAILLAQLGANVTLMARNEASLKMVLSELPTLQSQTHQYIVADFSEHTNVAHRISEFVEKAKSNFHILINNTGGPAAGKIQGAKSVSFLEAFNAHLLCNHVLCEALLPGMKKEGYGRIINVISTSVKQPIPGLGVSNTIRGAVASWSKTLAGELGEFGITVNNVLPGATETERLQSILQSKAEKQGKTIECIKEEMLSEIPLHRFAQAEEIAYAIAFLASPAAAYISGINLPIDGGRTQCL